MGQAMYQDEVCVQDGLGVKTLSSLLIEKYCCRCSCFHRPRIPCDGPYNDDLCTELGGVLGEPLRHHREVQNTSKVASLSLPQRPHLLARGGLGEAATKKSGANKMSNLGTTAGVRVSKRRMSHKHGREVGPHLLTCPRSSERIGRIRDAGPSAVSTDGESREEPASTILPFRSSNWLRKRTGSAQANVP